MIDALRTTDKDFESTVIKSDVPVLVDFWASWCTPCKMSDPIIKELAREYNGKVKIAKINVDQNPKTAAKYKIMGVPTYILFHSGDEIERKVGAQSKDQLMKIVDPLL
jgi:thioredoxin 1